MTVGLYDDGTPGEIFLSHGQGRLDDVGPAGRLAT